MSIFDKEDDFAEVARRLKEIKATEEAWFAQPPFDPNQPVEILPVPGSEYLPDLEQEWWDAYYTAAGLPERKQWDVCYSGIGE